MKKREISLQQWKIYAYLKDTATWVTNREIAEATGVSLRRTSAHTTQLVDLGVVEQAAVYPGHRFKLSDTAAKDNQIYLQRLEQAGDIFTASHGKG